jgi:hypothetical protein
MASQASVLEADELTSADEQCRIGGRRADQCSKVVGMKARQAPAPRHAGQGMGHQRAEKLPWGLTFCRKVWVEGEMSWNFKSESQDTAPLLVNAFETLSTKSMALFLPLC